MALTYRLKRKTFARGHTQEQEEQSSGLGTAAKVGLGLAAAGATAFAAHRGYLGGRLMKVSNRALYNVGNLFGSQSLMHKGAQGYLAGDMKVKGIVTGKGAREFYKTGYTGLENANANNPTGNSMFFKEGKGLNDVESHIKESIEDTSSNFNKKFNQLDHNTHFLGADEEGNLTGNTYYGKGAHGYQSPVKTEAEATGQQTQPTSTQTQPTSTQTQPTSTQTQPTSTQTQPTSDNNNSSYPMPPLPQFLTRTRATLYSDTK